MSSIAMPSVEVLGLYSPRANIAHYQAFVRRYVDSVDPRNFSEQSLATLRGLGRNPVPLSPEERLEVANELEYNLGNSAYVEVLIRNVDNSFDPGDFKQPDPSVTQGLHQVAWNETYLTEDGQSVIAGYPLAKPPAHNTLRVVFVIHFWKPGVPLASTYGELSCPAMQPLPERLWKLAPYEPVD